MSRTNDFTKNTMILLIGNLCTKIAQFLLLPLYTGILSPDEYGAVELANTIVTLLLPLIGLQIEQGVFRFLIDTRGNKNETRKLISSTFFFMLAANIIGFIVFLIFSPIINYEYKWFIILNIMTNSMFGFAMQVARGMGDNKAYAISGFLSTIATISLNIFFLIALHFRVTGLLYASAIGYVVSTIYLFTKLKLPKYISTAYTDKKILKSLLHYSIPVVFNSLSWWMFLSSDRIVISGFMGLSATGILAIAYKFSSVGILLYNVFYMSLAESVALHIKDQDFEQFYNKIFTAISQIFVSFGTLLIAFMPIIFRILIDPDYNDAYNLVPIATIATTFQVFVGLYSTIYTAKGNTRAIAVTSIIAAIVNISIDLLTVKFIGVYAAVLSTLISYFILFIHRLIDINSKYIKVQFNKAIFANLIISCVAVSGLYYVRNPIIALLNIILAITSAYIYNKNNILYVIELITKKSPYRRALKRK